MRTIIRSLVIVALILGPALLPAQVILVPPGGPIIEPVCDFRVISDVCDARTHAGVCTMQDCWVVKVIEYRDAPRIYVRPGGLGQSAYNNRYDPGEEISVRCYDGHVEVSCGHDQ